MDEKRRIEARPRALHAVFGVLLPAVLAGTAGCGPLRLTIVGSRCLNASLEDCSHASDPVSVSKAADLRIYQLTAPIDLQLLDYQALLDESVPALDRIARSHLDVTVLPGETVAVEVPRDDNVRYLLFFFQGRERGGDRTWLRLARFPRLGRKLSVELRGFSVQVTGRRTR